MRLMVKSQSYDWKTITIVGFFVGIPSSWNVNILLKSVLESSIPYQPTILDQISPKCWMVKNTENFDKVDSQSTKKQVEHS